MRHVFPVGALCASEGKLINDVGVGSLLAKPKQDPTQTPSKGHCPIWRGIIFILRYGWFICDRILWIARPSLRQAKPVFQVLDFPNPFPVFLFPDIFVANALVFEDDIDEILDPAVGNKCFGPV